MAELQLTATARADLDEAFEFLAERNEKAADEFLDNFWARAKLHAAQPRMGHPRDGLRSGWRSFVVGRYVVFYRIGPGGVEITRILHGSRDAEAELAGDESDN